MSENYDSKWNEDKVTEFLNQLETISEQVSEKYIYLQIGNYIKEKYNSEPPKVLLWEEMAFAFTEKYYESMSEWGTFFYPLFTISKDKGDIVEYPSIQEITSEIISYWEKRLEKSNHPVFKARYSNLIWDFSERIRGEKPHFSVAQIFIDSVIEIAKNKFQKYQYVIPKLKRALSLAFIINDKNRTNQLIDVIIDYEDKVGEDDKPYSWGFSYELLLKNKNLRIKEEKEQKIIRDLEERFERLIKGNDIWGAKSSGTLIADYYSRRRDISKIKEIISKLVNIAFDQISKTPAIALSNYLMELTLFCLQYGLKDLREEILNKIKNIGEKVKSEFNTVKTKIEIPVEEIEKYVEDLIEGDLSTVLQKITISYIPIKEKVKQQLQHQSKVTPILYSIPQEIFDRRGFSVATLGPLEEDIDGHIVRLILQNMITISFLLRKTLDALIKKFNLNTQNIINYLYESPIFDEHRKSLLVKGIDAYLNNDFVDALHILIPQVEALVRNLAEKIGSALVKIDSRSENIKYRTLDDLLRDEKINKVLTEDICLYFRVLFTDPKGINLRNYICHGICEMEDFNQTNADRVFHALLCLSLFR